MAINDYDLKSVSERSRLARWAIFVAFFLVACPLIRATTINFDQFSDGTILTTQIAGLTFTDTEVLTAGISLNEIDFPPHSGANVAIDNGGAITITFSTPVTSFSGYFTYTVPLTITGLNSASAILAKTISSYANNTGTGGAVGSMPDQFLQIGSATGISSVTILGSTLGGSFAMDDISFTTATTTVVPEPSTLIFFFTALICLPGAGRMLAKSGNRLITSAAPKILSCLPPNLPNRDRNEAVHQVLFSILPSC